MKSFEIHTMRDGRWGIDSVFNDRDLALFEARRVDENRRYNGVRVIEEVYDETSGMTTHRTIFRGRKSSARKADRRKRPDRTSRAAPAPRGGVGQERAPRARAPAHEPKKKSMLVPVLLALLLLVIGVAGLLGLHLLSGTIG
jgi:hypothetical protein